MYGALLKNEQDVHLFERLAFLARRGGDVLASDPGLRNAGLPASITEYLTLMAAMKAGVAEYSVEDFYYLSRATLVKDERHLDKFDRVFGACFKGLEPPEGVKLAGSARGMAAEAGGKTADARRDDTRSRRWVVSRPS